MFFVGNQVSTMERIAELIRASAAARESAMAVILELQESTSSTSEEGSIQLVEVCT